MNRLAFFLLAAGLCAGLRAAPEKRAGWYVAPLNGAPALYRNGEAVVPVLFWQWELQEKDVRDMSAAGVSLFSMFGSYPHYANPYWKSDGTLDMSYYDRHIGKLLSWAPEAAFLPRLFSAAPDWWIAAHPEEQTHWCVPRGKHPARESFASLACRDALSVFYRKAVRHLRARWGEHLMGIHVANGPWGEHFQWDAYEAITPGANPRGAFGDMSEPMRQAFIRYLRKKYGNDVSRLRDAFKDAYATFEGVSIPERAARLQLDAGMWRDPARSRRVIDFFECLHDTTVGLIDHYCKIVKEESRGELATMAFYGYVQDEYWAQESDHRAPSKMYLSPHLDMLSAPHTYRRRGLGEDGMQRQYLASAARHGKFFIDEGDDMTHLEMLKKHPDYRCCARTMADSLALLYREFGMTVTHGTGLWYMDLKRNTFRDPVLVDAVGRMRKWAKVALRHDRAHHSEVAVVSQPESAFYHGYRKTAGDTVTEPLYVDQMGAFFRAGAPFDWYLAEDLDAVLEGSAKVVAFLDCQYLTEKQYAQALALKAQGRTLVFFHAPGYVHEKGLSWERVKRLTGGETYEKLRLRDAGELRDIYAKAGVHVYTGADVVLSANTSWLMLHTREKGIYPVKLPRTARRITEITTEKVVAENADTFAWPLEKHATAVFLLTY